MLRTRFILALGLAALAALTLAPLGSAEALRTWVSGTGDDANPCSRTSPCKTFAGAISKTARGGIIDCIDSGGFGAVTITKSITLDCRGHTAGVLVAGTNALVVNITDPADIRQRVIIRHLAIQAGADLASAGLVGIKFIAGKSLTVTNTTVDGFTNGTGAGIYMDGPGRLTVRNSEVDYNTYGIVAGPPSGTVRGAIVNTGFDHNQYGMYSGTGSHLTVQNGEASDNSVAGMIARAGGKLNVFSSLVEGNVIGLKSDGPGSVLRASDTTVTDNDTGLSFVNTGQLLSRGNNTVQDNTANGAFSGPFSPN